MARRSARAVADTAGPSGSRRRRRCSWRRWRCSWWSRRRRRSWRRGCTCVAGARRWRARRRRAGRRSRARTRARQFGGDRRGDCRQGERDATDVAEARRCWRHDAPTADATQEAGDRDAHDNQRSAAGRCCRRKRRDERQRRERRAARTRAHVWDVVLGRLAACATRRRWRLGRRGSSRKASTGNDRRARLGQP